MSRNQNQNVPAFDLNRPEEYLSPEQRLDAVAEILASIGLRAMKETETPPCNEPDSL